MIKIFPSLISADLLNLATAINQLEPHCSGFHLDVMDDHFVPNLTWGHMFINTIAKKTNKTLFVHLMVENPETWLSKLDLRDCDILTFHVENKIDHLKLIKEIKEKKYRAALAINPKTALEEIFPFLQDIHQVLLMSVQPGFSGQAFLDSSIDRLNALIDYRKQHNLSFEIVMDGGINEKNIAQLVRAGVDQVAIAAGIFGSENPVENINKLKSSTTNIATQ